MSFTPAVAETLRQALATVVVVPVTPLHADGIPDWEAYAALTRAVWSRRSSSMWISSGLPQPA